MVLILWPKYRVVSPNQTLADASYYLGEGNGTPLQYSCLENPMDGRALLFAHLSSQWLPKKKKKKKTLQATNSPVLMYAWNEFA